VCRSDTGSGVQASLAMIPADLDFTAFVGDQTGQDFFSD
jgi:hypothetical protein